MNEKTIRGTWLCSLLFVCVDCAGPAFSAGASGETVAGSGGIAGQPGAIPSPGVVDRGGSPPVVPAAQVGGAGGEVADDDPKPAGGSAGASGGSAGPTGGSAGAGPSDRAACPAPVVGALRVSVCQENEDPFAPGDHASHEPHPFLLLTNDGPNVRLSRIKVRYFFSAEVSGNWQADYFWATKLNGAPLDSGKGFSPGPQLSVQPWSPAQPDADHRLELSFEPASTVVLPSGKSLEVRAWFRTDAEGQLIQSDDWSFVPSSAAPRSVEGFVYRENAHVALYVDDHLEWGAEPCRTMTDASTL